MQPKCKAMLLLNLLLVNVIFCLASPRSSRDVEELTSLEEKGLEDLEGEGDQEDMEKYFQLDGEEIDTNLDLERSRSENLKYQQIVKRSILNNKRQDGREGEQEQEGRDGTDGQAHSHYHSHLYEDEPPAAKINIFFRGPIGRDGQDWESGEQGLQGERGPPGKQGPPGEEGPLGEEGPSGDEGPPGDEGPSGEQGQNGRNGTDGQDGDSGPAGEPGLGIPGPVGPEGPGGSPGTPGADGSRGSPGTAGSRGPAGPPGQDAPNPGTVGSTYVRWGRTVCPATAELVFDGIVGGSHYTHPGGGSNYLCLPKTPEYDTYQSGNSGNRALIYLGEYQTTDFAPYGFAYEHDVPCAVCYVSRRGTQKMFPALKNCPTGWTHEYHGYLMSEKYDHSGSTEFVCVDRNPELVPASSANLNGVLFYPVESRCNGALECGKYVNEKELTCSVCTK